MRNLLERADSCALGAEELKRRLKSHLIPFEQLAKGPFDSTASDFKQRVRVDYQSFLDMRGVLLAKGARLACDGKSADLVSVVTR
jgi:hypothetical protein